MQAQQITLKLHHFVPPSSTAHVNLLLPWVERVEKESGGRIKIQIYPAMQLGGSMSQLLEQVADGVVDIAWTLPGASAGRDRTHCRNTFWMAPRCLGKLCPA